MVWNRFGGVSARAAGLLRACLGSYASYATPAECAQRRPRAALAFRIALAACKALGNTRRSSHACTSDAAANLAIPWDERNQCLRFSTTVD